MSDFDEKMIQRLKRLEREVERLQRWERPAGGGGVTDHGALTGLLDNDHPQYLLTTGKAADSDKLDGIDSTGFATSTHNHDHGALTGLGDNDHPQYLLTTGKAADSDKLDGIDSTGFVNTTSAQTVDGVKTFSAIPVLPSSNPTTANQAVRKGYADTTYLGISAKAADSDKLDGYDSSVFGRPVFLTTPLTSTSWDGDTKTTSDRAIVDLSSVFGVPAGVKAVMMSMQTQADAINDYIRFGPGSTYNYTLVCRTTVASQIAHATGIVPCDSNGDVYCYPSGTVEGVWVWIWGYWL